MKKKSVTRKIARTVPAIKLSPAEEELVEYGYPVSVVRSMRSPEAVLALTDVKSDWNARYEAGLRRDEKEVGPRRTEPEPKPRGR